MRPPTSDDTRLKDAPTPAEQWRGVLAMPTEAWPGGRAGRAMDAEHAMCVGCNLNNASPVSK
jgi:hypothetical protein